MLCGQDSLGEDSSRYRLFGFPMMRAAEASAEPSLIFTCHTPGIEKNVSTVYSPTAVLLASVVLLPISISSKETVTRNRWVGGRCACRVYILTVALPMGCTTRWM